MKNKTLKKTLQKIKIILIIAAIIIGVAILPLVVVAPQFFIYPTWAKVRTEILPRCFHAAEYCSKQNKFNDNNGCSLERFSGYISIAAAFETAYSQKEQKTNLESLSTTDRYNLYKQMCHQYGQPNIATYFRELRWNIFGWWRIR